MASRGSDSKSEADGSGAPSTVATDAGSSSGGGGDDDDMLLLSGPVTDSSLERERQRAAAAATAAEGGESKHDDVEGAAAAGVKAGTARAHKKPAAKKGKVVEVAVDRFSTDQLIDA